MTSEVIWNEGADRTEHENLATARKKAAKLSHELGRVIVLCWEGEDLSKGWLYEKGQGSVISEDDLGPTWRELEENLNKAQEQEAKSAAEADEESEGSEPNSEYVDQDQGEVHSLFKVRKGSIRAKVIARLLEGGPVEQGELRKIAYGKDDPDMTSALGMVLKGVVVTVKDRPYELKRTKDGSKVFFELAKVR